MLTVLKYVNPKQDSEISAPPLCLGNVSKDFSVDYMRKTRLYGYVCDFSVEYDSIDVEDVLDIRECFIKKDDIK